MIFSGRLSEFVVHCSFSVAKSECRPRWNNSMMLGSSKVLLPCPKPAYRKHRKQLPLLTAETLRAKHCFLKRSVSGQVKEKWINYSFKLCSFCQPTKPLREIWGWSSSFILSTCWLTSMCSLSWFAVTLTGKQCCDVGELPCTLALLLYPERTAEKRGSNGRIQWR